MVRSDDDREKKSIGFDKSDEMSILDELCSGVKRLLSMERENRMSLLSRKNHGKS